MIIYEFEVIQTRLSHILLNIGYNINRLKVAGVFTVEVIKVNFGTRETYMGQLYLIFTKVIW